MLGFGRGETSPVPSAESAVHSSNPPSTRGPDGTMPRYPTVRVPGVSPRPTTPAPIPKGWRGGGGAAGGRNRAGRKGSGGVGRGGNPRAFVGGPRGVVGPGERPGGEVCGGPSASASIGGPPAAAAVEVPLIHPFQSRESRFESNSQRVAERTAPPYPETSSIRSAPRPST